MTTKTFQGLTVACARCHDHKFDPIPTTDFYSLYGIVESARFTPVPILSEGYLAGLSSLIDFNKTLRLDIANRWQSSLGVVPAVPASMTINPPTLRDTTGSWELLGDFRDGAIDAWFADGAAFEGGTSHGFPVIEDARLVQLSEGVASSRHISKGIPGALRSPTFTIAHDTITVMAKRL